jgi:hypothetical protein
VETSVPNFSELELDREKFELKSQAFSPQDLEAGTETSSRYEDPFPRGLDGPSSRTNTTSLELSHDGDISTQLSRFTSQTLSQHSPREIPGEDTRTSIEVDRLKQELLAANSRIAQQEQELAQTRVIKHTLDQALGSSDLELGERDISVQTISDLQNAFNASTSTRLFSGSRDLWGTDESRPDGSDPWSTGSYSKMTSLWTPPTSFIGENNYNDIFMPRGLGQESSRPWHPQPGSKFSPHEGSPAQRVLSGPSSIIHNTESPNTLDRSPYGRKVGLASRRSVSQLSRAIPIPEWEKIATGPSTAAGMRSPTASQFTAYAQPGMYPTAYYQPQPVGASLSPVAAEFTLGTGTNSQWPNAMVRDSEFQTYP